jgi:hypothetical protein
MKYAGTSLSIHTYLTLFLFLVCLHNFVVPVYLSIHAGFVSGNVLLSLHDELFNQVSIVTIPTITTTVITITIVVILQQAQR